MKINKIQVILFMLIILFFQSCGLNKNTIKSVAQTNSASQIEIYKDEILNSLLTYKQKLDLRNPNAYNKAISANINHQIVSKQDYVNIIYKDKKLEKYNEYFHYAFLEEPINNRNDFLIIGLYKLIYKAFKMENEHQFTAVQYDVDEMKNLYEYLQVLRWKIRTNKDSKGNYFFNTWQNNWQLELEKKYTDDYNIINNLEYIKSKKESIYDSSNFSFEMILSKMITNTEHTLRKINVEPYEMGFNAIKSFVFII